MGDEGGSSAKGNTRTQVRSGTKEWRVLLCHGLRSDETKPAAGGSSKSTATVELMAWGGGYHGQLGVKLPASKKSVNRGEVIQLPQKDEPSHVACGGSFSAVVTSSGAVYTWGMGKNGQLGYELTSVSGQQMTPLQVTGLSSVQIMAIACGREHTLVLSFSGDMYAWGSNKYGQLGVGNHHNHRTPEPLKSDLDGKPLKFSKIDAGDNHSAALSSFNRLYTWGNGVYGQLGHGDPKKRGEELKELSPKLVEHLPLQCKAIACGASQTTVISADGKVHVCGSVERYASQPGMKQPVTTCQFLYEPGLVDMKPPVLQVASGKAHIILLTESQDVYTIGAGAGGQLGHGKRTDLVTPRLILQGKQIIHVAAGRYHSVAITAHGTMYTWGSGEHGQLCHGVDGDEMIPRVVDSLLHRAMLKAACGENHTIALCTAPIEDSNAELTPDMVVWRFHEHEEYEQKQLFAARYQTGVTKKHLQQVQAMVGDLIKEYEEAMRAQETGNPEDKDSVVDSEVAETQKLLAGKEGKLGVSAVQAFMGKDAGGGNEEEMFVPLEHVKEKVMQRVLKSGEFFNNWLEWTKNRPGSRDGNIDAAKDDAVTLPPAGPGKAAARPARKNVKTSGVTTKLPQILPRTLRPAAPRKPQNATQLESDREPAPTMTVAREEMYAKLGELQAAVRKSVNDVMKDDPSSGIEKMEQELIALRDVCSGMEAQRRLRAEEIEGLRTDLDGLTQNADEDAIKELLGQSDALQVQLQAVRLKYEEEKENREIYEIVIQQLQDELNDQSHLISDLKDVQRENGILLERMGARKDAAVELMVDTQKEGRRIETESKVLREGLNEHLMGVRKLVQYMERTVSHVAQVTEERHEKEQEKKIRKVEKLKIKLEKTLERKDGIRKTATGAAEALGTWLEKKFLTISDATGFNVDQVEKIVERIASRDEVRANMFEDQEQKKKQLRSLHAIKTELEQELIDARASSASEKTLRQMENTRKKLDLTRNETAKPREKWLEATISLVKFRQLTLSIIEKVDLISGQKRDNYNQFTQGISLWQPIDNVEKNTLAYLELLSQLAARLELIESAEEDEEEEESYANDTEHDLAAAAGAGASGALADVEAAA